MFKHILYNVSNIQTDVWAILTIRNLIQFGQPSGQFADRFFLQVTHFDIRNRHGAEDQNAQQYYIKLHSVITNNVIKFKRNTQRIYSNLDIWCVPGKQIRFFPYVVYSVSLHWHTHSTVHVATIAKPLICNSIILVNRDTDWDKAAHTWPGCLCCTLSHTYGLGTAPPTSADQSSP